MEWENQCLQETEAFSSAELTIYWCAARSWIAGRQRAVTDDTHVTIIAYIPMISFAVVCLGEPRAIATCQERELLSQAERIFQVERVVSLQLREHPYLVNSMLMPLPPFSRN